MQLSNAKIIFFFESLKYIQKKFNFLLFNESKALLFQIKIYK